MTDWRSEQIGLGVTRCPSDPENLTEIEEADRWLLDAWPQTAPEGFALGERVKRWFRR